MLRIEYESSESKIDRLVKSDSYKSKIKKNISHYEPKKMKFLMMWLVCVFGVLSVYFCTIFSWFSGNFVLNKKKKN